MGRTNVGTCTIGSADGNIDDRLLHSTVTATALVNRRLGMARRSSSHTPSGLRVVLGSAGAAFDSVRRQFDGWGGDTPTTWDTNVVTLRRALRHYGRNLRRPVVVRCLLLPRSVKRASSRTARSVRGGDVICTTASVPPPALGRRTYGCQPTRS